MPRLPATARRPIVRSDALINTSFAGGAVAHQIADRVASEASTLTAQTGRPDAPAFAVKHEPAVKVLHIQLQPEGLGTVTIRMSVKDQALRLDLEVGRGETAAADPEGSRNALGAAALRRIPDRWRRGENCRSRRRQCAERKRPGQHADAGRRAVRVVASGRKVAGRAVAGRAAAERAREQCFRQWAQR